jgi:hypothetical protein
MDFAGAWTAAAFGFIRVRGNNGNVRRSLAFAQLFVVG